VFGSRTNKQTPASLGAQWFILRQKRKSIKIFLQKLPSINACSPQIPEDFLIVSEADGADDGKARYGLLQKRVSNGIELWKKTIFVHHDVSQEFKDAYEKLRKPRDVRAAGLLSI
jgi:hypothetical protein